MSNNEILLSLQAALADLRIQQAMLQHELERQHVRMVEFQENLEYIDHVELFETAWDFAEIQAAMDAGDQHIDILNDSLEENARDISNTLSAIQYIEDEIYRQEHDAFEENYDANIEADITECMAAQNDW